MITFKYQTQFGRLPVNTIFNRNGLKYRKKSTRTAVIITPVEYSGKWFYFSKNDLITIRHQDIDNLDKNSPNARHWERLREAYPAIECNA